MFIDGQTEEARARDDETLVLCSALAGEVIARDRPRLAAEERLAAIVAIVKAMVARGIYAENGKLRLPAEYIEGPLAFPVGSA